MRGPQRGLRITGGVYTGRRVQCPPGIIRPAMDRMRESLFAILGDIEGLSFLDLYSGSGVVGIEAASRGAEPVILVERDRNKQGTILKNIAFVDTEMRLSLQPALRYIRLCHATFDLIYLDPPFRMAGKPAVVAEIQRRNLLAPTGTLVIHVPRQEDLGRPAADLELSDTRIYGGSVLYFYRPKA